MTVEALELSVIDDSRTLHLRPVGHLDAGMAAAVLRAAARAASVTDLNLVIDLGGLSGFDEDAVLAVTACRRLARHLPSRVRVQADGDVGRRLLGRSRTAAP